MVSFPEWNPNQLLIYWLTMHIYIYNSRPWRWSALNMGFVVKWPSKMQGQCFFRSWTGRTVLFGQIEKFSRSAAPARIWHPQKFVCFLSTVFFSTVFGGTARGSFSRTSDWQLKSMPPCTCPNLRNCKELESRPETICVYKNLKYSQTRAVGAADSIITGKEKTSLSMIALWIKVVFSFRWG